MQNNKDSLISFLQAFGIVLVVVGHSDYGIPDNPLHRWIYSFHMPLFMFISGFLFAYGFERRGTDPGGLRLWGRSGFLLKKARRLLVPYVAISSLAFLPKALMSRWAARPLDLSWSEYGKALLYPWDNPIIFFWFLPTLFLIFLLVGCAAKGWKLLGLPRVHCGWWLVPLLVLHLFNPLAEARLLNVGGVCSYLLYFWAGYCTCRIHAVHRIGPGLCLSAFALSVVFLLLPSFLGKGVLAAFNGIVLSIAFGQLYLRWGWRFFHHLYGASYAIYLFSWFPQVLSQQVLYALTGAPWPVGSALAVASGIYLPWLLFRWMARNKNRPAGKVIAFLSGH